MSKIKQNWKIGDCIELMQEIPDNTIDMVFADPPFNMGKDYGSTTDDNRSDYFEWCDEWIDESFRILKSTGSFYHMNLTRNLDKLMPIMSKYGIFQNLITWRNVSSWGNKKQFYSKYQPIMFYTKTDDYKFNTYVQREKLFTRWGKMSGKPQGQMGDVWDDISFVWAGSIHHPEAILKPGTNSKAHPAQMPVGLPKRCIEFSTDKDDSVCDPFLGSGTTLEACRLTGRSCIGFEISSEWKYLYSQRCIEYTPGLSNYI